MSSFDWHDVDPALRIRLCDGASDDPETTASLLAARFGTPPDERLVADQWAVLRDEWLLVDAPSRHEVVAALLRAGLGHGDALSGDLAAQMAYLRSCRNRGHLRTVVLGVFVAAAASSDERTPVGWDDVVAGLARTLDDLGADGRYRYLLVTVRGSGVAARGDAAGPTVTAGRGSSYYVQFLAAADHGLRAEAVSNTFLAPAERLPAAAQRQLVELGWQPPTHLPGQEEDDPEGSPNWYLDVAAPFAADELAAMAVATLRQVYGASTPDELGYQCVDAEGRPVAVPALGIARGPELVNTVADVEALLPTPRNSVELTAEVDRALAAVIAGDSIVRDEDGDIPILFGTTTVFVRVLGDAPVVRIFAVVLTDLTPSSALMDELNELNQHFVFAKLFWNGSSVVMSIDLPGAPFVGSHLVQAIGMLGNAADQLDEQLQARFGGRTLLGAAEPAPPEEPTPGYL